MSTHAVQDIPIEQIHPNPFNPRRDAGDIGDLVASIREFGILQNLVVITQPKMGADHYLLEAGFRRWSAGRHVPLETLPCRVIQVEDTEDLAWRALVTGLVENLHREDLNPMDKAKAFGKMRDEAGMSQTAIAERVKVSSGTVSRYQGLLLLSPQLQERVRNGSMTVERAINMIKQARKDERKRKGHAQPTVGWEPDHFTSQHPQARAAAAMCSVREHSSRRKFDGIACGECFETAIRADQAKITALEFNQSPTEAARNVVFQPPMPLSVSGTVPNGKNG